MDKIFPPGADVKVWQNHGDHKKVERISKLQLMTKSFYECKRCDYRPADHGAIGVTIVCPGDFIIRGSDGEYYAFHPETIAKGAE